MFANKTGKELTWIPYVIQNSKPIIKTTSITKETSSADFVLNVLINCGRKAIEVKNAAIKPNKSVKR
ncbi:hypothetical protein EV06_1396 [Prochlorococcus sp. MIT 0602]|nr:hypothetical protein EV06_1396 [Prochlorococcus sp. MIT 0602]KGG17802.1 hypothetical protein EV07_1244 [Prochlorococcus sp. MIT 0603]